MSTRRRIIVLSLSPLLFAACTGDDTVTDAGRDASHDATMEAQSVDAAAEAAKDASIDVAIDAPPDAAALDASDAEAGSSWNTPPCSGTIDPTQYGGSNYQTTSGTQNWYMTWDATNLYVAVDTADVTEASVIYVGFSGMGITAAQTYDSTGGTLAFAADGVVYAKSTYQEARTANADAGMWSAANTSAIMFCGTGTTRQEVIPWTALGATGIPSSFRFLAYVTSGAGFVYGQLPTTNPGGAVGTSATFNHDFYVASTADGTGSFPFDTAE
jgi:hypothetical protein